MNRALISVVMPAYNSQKYIFDAINSVAQQTYENWELIVVDDCSSDDTALIIKEFAKKDSRIKPIFNDKNSGTPAKAKNIALKHVNGDFIAFLDSDDIWLEDKLQKQLDFFNQNSDYFLCYSGGYVMDESGKTVASFTPKYRCGEIIDKLLMQYEINNQSVMIKKEVLKVKPFFDEDIVIGEDYNFFMNIAARFKICSIKDKLIKYRKHGTSISSNKKFIYQGTEKTVIELEKLLGFENYKEAFLLAYAKVDFYKAKFYFDTNEFDLGLSVLAKNRFLSFKYFLVYIYFCFFVILKKIKG